MTEPRYVWINAYHSNKPSRLGNLFDNETGELALDAQEGAYGTPEFGRLLVKAVNNHDNLVTVLEDISALALQPVAYGEHPDRFQKIADLADALLETLTD